MGSRGREMVFGKVRAGLIFTTFAVALFVLGLSADLAFGQGGGSDDVQYSAVCQNILGQINVTQNAVAGSTANGGGEGGSSEAAAEIAQELNISVEQVNECLNRADKGGIKEGVAATVIEQYGKDAVIVATIPDKVLPNTGGPPLLGLAILSLALIGVGTSILRAAIRRDR